MESGLSCKKLREKLPNTKILLLAIFPRSEYPSANRGNVLQINQIIRKLVDDRNIFWIDFGYQFVDSDGTIPTALMPDNLHLSAQGYAIWLRQLKNRSL